MPEHVSSIRLRAEEVRKEVERLRRQQEGSHCHEAESFADVFLFENQPLSTDHSRLSSLEAENKLYALEIQVLKKKITEASDSRVRPHRQDDREERKYLQHRLKEELEHNRLLQLDYEALQDQCEAVKDRLSQTLQSQARLRETISCQNSKIANLQRLLQEQSRPRTPRQSQLQAPAPRQTQHYYNSRLTQQQLSAPRSQHYSNSRFVELHHPAARQSQLSQPKSSLGNYGRPQLSYRRDQEQSYFKAPQPRESRPSYFTKLQKDNRQAQSQFIAPTSTNDSQAHRAKPKAQATRHQIALGKSSVDSRHRYSPKNPELMAFKSVEERQVPSKPSIYTRQADKPERTGSVLDRPNPERNYLDRSNVQRSQLERAGQERTAGQSGQKGEGERRAAREQSLRKHDTTLPLSQRKY